MTIGGYDLQWDSRRDCYARRRLPGRRRSAPGSTGTRWYTIMTALANDHPRSFALVLLTSRAGIRDLLQSSFRRERRAGKIPSSSSFATLTLEELIEPTTRAGSLLDAASVALVDVCPGPPLAIEICRNLQSRWPELRLASLACCPHHLTAAEDFALRSAGARSMIDESPEGSALIHEIQRVAQGVDVIHVQTPAGAPRALTGPVAQPDESAALPPVQLTEREHAVLGLLGEGLKQTEIFPIMHISLNTTSRTVARLKK
jgi:DNA-binding NarL/FixJ family response regulator